MEDSRDVAIAAPSQGEPIYPATVVSTVVTTRLSLQNGDAVLIALRTDSAKHSAQLVILSAAIVEPARVAED